MQKEQAEAVENQGVPFFAIVDDNHLSSIEEVAIAMENEGFRINRVRKYTGTISGLADNIDLIDQAQIEGVKIRPEQKYELQLVK